jgi:Flp pilus assembly pilin Flp
MLQKFIREFISDERAEAAISYCLLSVGIAAVLLIACTDVGIALRKIFERLSIASQP